MGELPVNFRFKRTSRYVTVCRIVPYVFNHAIRKPFRTAPPARWSTAAITNPEFRRVVHDLYCDMFLRGYRESTGYRAERATGLVLVLFAVFIYAFDDEFEERRSRGDTTETDAIITSPGVAEVWRVIGDYLRATGRGDEVRGYILTNFLGCGFDQYREQVMAMSTDGSLATAIGLVEFDSGEALRTAYQIIRIFNQHPYRTACAEEFFNLGMAGKFMDDMADYAQDVRRGVPNLLHACVREDPGDLDRTHSALTSDETMTARWWEEHCPVTYNRYLMKTASYYCRVASPTLRLPLDVYLALLGSRRFWTISTVRTGQHAT